ncbi:MAG: AMP-binding protein [Solirubrobacterales bacterium]|nr:AMP-binding protein [Solirubrobacterales bacterium]
MPPATVDLFAPPRIALDRRPDGSWLMYSRDELGDYPPSLGHHLRAGARRHPERTLVAERDGDGWATTGWGRGAELADAVGQALLDAGLGPRRPLMILSGNSVDHLLLTLGALLAGVPVLPISAAYSASPGGRERIRAIARRATPGMVFAEDPGAFGDVLAELEGTVEHHVVGRRATPAAGSARIGLASLMRTAPGPGLARAFAATGPDTVAKILFTSGSTGSPKGVINTHRMLCSNQAALGRVWPFLAGEPPVLVDWLPWSHTFGGNHNVNQVLAFGGSLYVDPGRPAPQLFGATVRSLSEIAPTVYYNVPAGWGLLVGRLESDRALAERFFSRLRFMFYAAAALPEDVWGRLAAVAAEIADHPVALTASWGTTETAPGATTAHFPDSPCGCIGVPLPGTTLRLVPAADTLEIRLRGPNVTPGYLEDPEATAAAFDDEGFYRPGDAVRLLDEADPARGLCFDGRLAEDFKLSTGTWVRVGKLRLALLAAAGVLSDAVICGHDRDHVAALGWCNRAETDRLGGADRVREHLAAALARHNAGAGSATRIERLLLLADPPSIDAGEITDKGYINQGAVLRTRAEAVAGVFADPPPPDIITPA